MIIRCDLEYEKAKSHASSSLFQSLRTVAPLEPEESTGLIITGSENIEMSMFLSL